MRRLLGSRAELEASRALLGALAADEALALGGGASLGSLRRSLRPSLARRQLSLAEAALAGLAEALGRLEALRGQVDGLGRSCVKVQSFLESTKRETRQVQTEAAALAMRAYAALLLIGIGALFFVGGLTWMWK